MKACRQGVESLVCFVFTIPCQISIELFNQMINFACYLVENSIRISVFDKREISVLIVKIAKNFFGILILFTKNQNLIRNFLKFLDKAAV